MDIFLTKMHGFATGGFYSPPGAMWGMFYYRCTHFIWRVYIYMYISQYMIATNKSGLFNMVIYSQKYCFLPIFCQVESKKAEFGERKRDAELERVAAREELARLQQALLDLTVEKRALEASHIHLQESRVTQDAEYNLLQREKSSALEQHTQVSHKMRGRVPHYPAWFTALSCALMGLVVTLKNQGKILDPSAVVLNTFLQEFHIWILAQACVLWVAKELNGGRKGDLEYKWRIGRLER